MATGKLTTRQAAFVAAYLISGNATQAAIEAGYSPKTARSQGERMLTNVDIASALAEGKAAAAKRAKVTLDELIAELDGVAMARLSDVVEWGPDRFVLRDSRELSDRALAAVESVKVKRRREVTGSRAESEEWEIEEITVKMHDKVRAIELSGKHRGAWPQKAIEVNAQFDVTIRENIQALRGLPREELLAAARNIGGRLGKQIPEDEVREAPAPMRSVPKAG